MKQMIFEDELRRRWKSFRAHGRAYPAVLLLAFLFLASLGADLWVNSKPLAFSYGGQWYFPIFSHYSAREFGQAGIEPDYRELEERFRWSVWPLIEEDPHRSDESQVKYPSPPDRRHWMGTDDRGRDVFARLVYGFRVSFGFALCVWVLSFSSGSLLGALSGFRGGWFDLVTQRIIEVFESLPVLLILMMLVSVFGGSFALLAGASVLFSWMMMAHSMRAEFLRLRQSGFVESGRAQGLRAGRIIRRHILPNALGPLVGYSPFFIAGQISALTTLDYLGLGLRPPTPSWGELLAQGQYYFTGAWWLLLFPSLALMATMVILTLIGAGVRSAFDPRTS